MIGDSGFWFNDAGHVCLVMVGMGRIQGQVACLGTWHPGLIDDGWFWWSNSEGVRH